MEDIAVSVKGVSKTFILPHENVNSLKGLFLGSFKKNKDKSFEVQKALTDINFEVKKGEFFGIVGRNGSGKSTLLKILAGIYQPSKGSVKVNGKLVPFIELGVGFNPELSGRENVYLNGALLGFSQKQVDKKYASIVDFAELERFMDQKLKNYSSGMQVRLAFSVATLLAESDVLLIDEVLAVGDSDFQRKCYHYFQNLKKLKKTVIFVSHDMNAVREYCDRAILIEKSELIEKGTSEKVSSKYSQLFLTQDNVSSKEGQGGDRWGDKRIEYESVNVVANGRIRISIKADIQEDIETALFGFSLKSSSGQSLLGTNTQLLQKKVSRLRKGTRISLFWEFDNILNDGTYSISVAATETNGVTIHDWWEDAASLKIMKNKRLPYPIDPEIDFELKEYK